MGKGKGKVVERKKEKKKRGRPSLSDVRKRTLKEEQKRNHNFSPHSASNYPIVTVPVPASGLAPLRRSARLNPYRYADESDADEICSEESESDESADERYSMRAIGRMTDEDRVRYREQVYRTDGFDVDVVRSFRGCSLIQPLNIRDEESYRTCEIISQRAIDQYHRRKQRRTSKPQTPLKFVKVLKAMSQHLDFLRYYVTFEAENVTGQSKIFQALARWRRPSINDDNFTVLFVRGYKKEKGDQVIGIHSVSELQSHLDAASMRSRLAIVFFSKTRPCRFISPLYTSLAGKYPKVVFLKVDIDEATDVAAWWNIRKAPYFFFVKEGKVVDKVVGIDAIELKEKVARHSRKQS
ncbi:uncharacterized protein LOC133869847 [Alnus glutinosa]|uniref:uncharacterized protein LOC133869847 n=1 Tax=Alnus glutinosa TaxID=3517 RepID=UPI002D788F21|nr:uncharacterized protein LOC133869847 [Alnus glutinosa]XP_062162923.1 uncharacterized protein LOC133869847 [Alnus glutinosa]